MLRQDKERIVEELAQRLRDTQTLMVADYRGLSMKQIDALRTVLLDRGTQAGPHEPLMARETRFV